MLAFQGGRTPARARKEVSVSIFRVALMSAAILLTPALAIAEEAQAPTSDLEQVLIESATTPEQHRALAAHFRAKSERVLREAKRHRRMGVAYSGGKLATAQALTQHCRKLAELNEAMAAEYKSLAEMHEAAAKK